MSEKKATVAIVYHSGYGHTKKMATAVAEGVDSVENAKSILMDVTEAQSKWGELEIVDAIIFGAPTYMGSLSAPFKAFMDATSPAVFAKNFAWKDKLAAGFTNSASRAGDKFNSLIQLVAFSAQHGMHWISLGLPPANNSTKGSEEDLNRTGHWLGAASQSNADQGPDLAPPFADLKTGSHLGARVANTTLQFKYGK